MPTTEKPVKVAVPLPLLVTVPLTGGALVEPTGNEPKSATVGANARQPEGAVETADLVRNASESEEPQLVQVN